ncbi:hypothetical protein [Pseudarthrobacter cellobiosi]|uniref:hypothetical protein n=1 Tax=Pseudarthrobacter cellobiosi TaxID=2953654 RepID=UPI00208FE429|nr:hypothetical protein [Pseudarthrobacter sp. HLT1-5]MCO4257392.1 hypothetical protein [Pseudarthrobacter sp. HLT1-5]
MIQDANAARQVINIPPQQGMTTQPATVDCAALAAAVAKVAAAVRESSERLAEQSRRIAWNLQIIFADTERERRRIRRDMARAYRKPALIHRGGKP